MKKSISLVAILFLAVFILPENAVAYNVYYGQLHSHTIISDGSGTPAQAYRYARDTAGLDFFSISDHDYWPGDLTQNDWATIKNAANSYNEDGVFTTFWGFEWTSDIASDHAGLLNKGHITVINSDDYCIAWWESTNDMNELAAWLDARDVVAFFNHPGQYGTTFDGFNSNYTDKIVGMELWNRSEDYYSNDGYYPGDGGLSYYDEALARGWYVGASGSQDNHGTDWGTMNEWRMAVLANANTRASIYDAIKNRRFYSTRDKNLALSFTFNGAQMGSKIAGGNLNVAINASDGNGEVFSKIELVKNGAVIGTWTPGITNPNLTTAVIGAPGDTFYVRLYQGGDWEAISSPIFIISAAPPGADPPTPNPMTWVTVPDPGAISTIDLMGDEANTTSSARLVQKHERLRKLDSGGALDIRRDEPTAGRFDER
jgi:hypothetical protein